MPTVADVAQLFAALGQSDIQEAHRCAQRLIAHERQQGREQAARQLEMAAKRWLGAGAGTLVELPAAVKEWVWSAVYETKSLSELYLADDVCAALERLIREHEQADMLRAAGLPPRHRILLAGPPGNGKTSLAAALAKRLDLPCWAVQTARLLSSYLGTTGQNLSKLFQEIGSRRVLLFLDELDSLGSARGGAAEGSAREYNHTLNTILVQLDRLAPSVLLVAATNRPDLLDPALERRFAVKLWLDGPDEEAARQYVDEYRRRHDVAFPNPAPEGSTPCAWRSWAQVERYCQDRHRAVLLGEDVVGGEGGDWVGRHSVATGREA